MQRNYTVRVTKDYLTFSAAHFITFAGNICERLHGHNYGVFAEVEGPLDENHYVIDFIALRDSMKELVDRLDHHVLLPMHHPAIRVRTQGNEVITTFEERRWVFPAGDCVLLPVANTTAELIANFLAEQLLMLLDQKGITRPEVLRVGVDENNGQWGIVELSVTPDSGIRFA
jgi:6-pyruvoyltetrahydropterin/6-carboxytetrahydropterin synthase